MRFDDLEGDKRLTTVRQSRLIAESYRQLTGRDLLPGLGDGSGEEVARLIFEAPFVVVSAGGEGDPILNYANATALRLWEMSWDELTCTPARKTAEPMHREERARFLEKVRADGFIDDYAGIRISSTGRRFRIERATVWNLLNRSGEYGGQAATFADWSFLD